MASIIKETVIDRTVADVWDAVRDFGAVHERLAPGFLTECHLDGDDVRVVTFANGAEAREVLVGLDDTAHRLAYTVVAGPLGFAQHSASVQVLPADNGRSRFVWITDVLPEEAADEVEALMAQGIAAIRETLQPA
jgi:uncharacterized protein YndB with AHSA1/START domain